VSPFSAEVALALALSGAEGPTAEEIRTTLHLPNNPDLILKTFKSLLTSLEHHDQDYHLRNVNKIYLNKNFAIKNDFRNTALSVFGADLENVEFSQSVEAAKTINHWVEKQTENKIHDLVDPANLNDFTRSILINALYFQANWTNQFKNYFTIKEKFHPTTKDVVQVEMMTDFENDYNYYASEELEASFLEMPFEGEEASITFVLPDAVDGLADLEQQIDQVFIKPNYTSAGVFVSIPKFKIESSLDFKEILGNVSSTFGVII
jgi:serpin B